MTVRELELSVRIDLAGGLDTMSLSLVSIPMVYVSTIFLSIILPSPDVRSERAII